MPTPKIMIYFVTRHPRDGQTDLYRGRVGYFDLRLPVYEQLVVSTDHLPQSGRLSVLRPVHPPPTVRLRHELRRSRFAECLQDVLLAERNICTNRSLCKTFSDSFISRSDALTENAVCCIQHRKWNCHGGHS